MKKLRTFSADFKAKIALEALRKEEPLHVIARRYEVHANTAPMTGELRGQLIL